MAFKRSLEMPGKTRPLSRHIINRWSLVPAILVEFVLLLVFLEMMWEECGPAVFMFLIDGFVLFHCATWFWRERNLWSEYEGRKIKITPCGRDGIDVCMDGRCVRVYAEMVTGGVALSYDSIRHWRTSPMTEKEREEVSNILLEDFESRGAKVYLSGGNLPNSPHVETAQARIARELLHR